MAAVFADHEAVLDALGPAGEVTIAAINGPANVVVTGPESEVEALLATLLDRNVESRRLVISNGFHSPQVEPILDAFEAVAAGVSLSEPTIPLVSNLTGSFVEPGQVSTPEYWRRHLREAVLFGRGVEALASGDSDVFLEIGPHGTLIGLGQECVPSGQGTWVSTLRRGREDWIHLLETVSQLYVRGVEIDWRGFDSDYSRRLVDLPTYPFQRERYWLPLPPGEEGGVDRQKASRRDRTVETANGPPEEHGADLAAELLGAPPSDRAGLVVAFVRRHVMDVLRMREGELPDRRDRLTELGLDSLMAVELKGRLHQSLGGKVDLPATLVFDYPTIGAIAELILTRLEVGAGTEGEGVPTGRVGAGESPEPGGKEEIASLSEDEVERLLLDRLEELEGE